MNKTHDMIRRNCKLNKFPLPYTTKFFIGQFYGRSRLVKSVIRRKLSKENYYQVRVTFLKYILVTVNKL